LNSQWKLFETDYFKLSIAVPFVMTLLDILISKELIPLEEDFVHQIGEVAKVDLNWFKNTFGPMIIAKCSGFRPEQQHSLALHLHNIKVPLAHIEYFSNPSRTSIYIGRLCIFPIREQYYCIIDCV
jgi:hypothetical protein